MTLTVHELGKTFGRTPVLADVSFTVPAGSRLALVGPSGSGKSTLLRLIGGFEQPDHGRIQLDDRTLAGTGVNVPAHRRRIGYVPQDGALFPHLTVAGNIGFGIPRTGSRAVRVRQLMQLCSLPSSLAGRLPHELSGGQQQRVALARTLATSPDAVLLDEPFSALDAELRDATRTVVVEILDRSGVTAVLVTHDHAEALSFGDLVGVLIDGRLVQHGAPADVYDNPASLRVARLLGETIVIPAHRNGTAATTGLGRIRVRHDRSAGSPDVVALVRPDQLHLVPDPGAAVVVEDVRGQGATTAITLRLDGDGTSITLPVPQRETPAFPAGATVRVQVDGGVILCPAPMPAG